MDSHSSALCIQQRQRGDFVSRVLKVPKVLMPSLILLKQGDFRGRALACQFPLCHPRTPWQEETCGSAKVARLSNTFIWLFFCWLFCLFLCLLFACTTLYLIVLPRKLVRVNKIIVHQNFSTHSHDIALLKLGKFSQFFSSWRSKSIAEERVDLSKFPPVCLPQTGEVFPLNTTAFVYGGFALQVMIIWSYWL